MAATGTYGSYYQNDGGYSTPSPAPKAPVKKEAKSTFPGPPGVGGGAQGAYQTTPGQSAYNQYGQGYGQGNKTFNQNQAGAGVYPYSTAYPSQVTGSAVASQDYSYEGKLDSRRRGTQVHRNLSCFIDSFTNQLTLFRRLRKSVKLQRTGRSQPELWCKSSSIPQPSRIRQGRPHHELPVQID